MMTLTSVTIRKYKSIETEQSFDVDERITTLVGKNEAGKTAILEALAKSNYFDQSDTKFRFDATYDYPRKEKKKFDKAGKDVEVITCIYVLSPQLLKKIQDDVGKKTFTAREIKHSSRYLTSTQYFEGTEIDRKQFVIHKMKEYNIVDKDLQKLIEETSSVTEIKTYISDPDYADYVEFLQDIQKYFTNEWQWKGKDVVQEYILRIWIKPNMPKFLYYDEYYELPSEVEIKKLEDKNIQDERLKTSKALFELADVSIKGLLNDSNYESYKAELEATSNEITSTLFKYWKTNSNLRVEFDIQKNIKQNGNTAEVNPILKSGFTVTSTK